MVYIFTFCVRVVLDESLAIDNYLTEVSLISTFALSDNSNYKLQLIDAEVPNFKGQAFW